MSPYYCRKLDQPIIVRQVSILGMVLRLVEDLWRVALHRLEHHLARFYSSRLATDIARSAGPSVWLFETPRRIHDVFRQGKSASFHWPRN